MDIQRLLCRGFKLILLLALSLTAALLLSSCKKEVKRTKWETYQEPVKPVELPVGLSSKVFNKLWSINVGSGATDGFALLRPAQVGSSILAASRDGDVVRVDSANGKTIWRTRLKSEIFSGVAADETTVVVTFDNSDVTALDYSSGEILWTHTLGKQVSAPPAVGKGRVVVRAVDGTVNGLDSSTGEQVWSFQRPTQGLSVHGDPAPVISGDAILTGFSNGKLVVSNLINGRVFWEKALSIPRGSNEIDRLNDIDTLPMVAINTVYSATYQGDVVAMRLQNSNELWRTRMSTRLPMSRDQDTIFVTTALGSVAAIDAVDGKILWQQDALQGYGVSMPAVLSDQVLVGDSKGSLYLLNRQDGSISAKQAVGNGAVLNLINDGDRVIVYTSKGSLSAVSL